MLPAAKQRISFQAFVSINLLNKREKENRPIADLDQLAQPLLKAYVCVPNAAI